jgi:hypothetical protein
MLKRGQVFWAFSALCLIAALYHLAGIFTPVNSSPPLRHGAFALIDLVCAVCFLRRPRWYSWSFAALTVHQCWSHGSSLAAGLTNGQVTWIDIVVVVITPVAAIVLFIDQVQTRSH